MNNSIFTFISRLRQYITRRRLLIVGLCVTAVIMLGGTAAHLLERGVNPKLASLKNAMLWAAALVLAAGATDAQPITEAAIFLRIGLRIAGTGFVGLLTATIATILLDSLLRQGKGLRPVRFAEHLLILGYNDKVRQIIDEVRLESPMPITLLADLPEKPFDATDFFFVRGKPYEEGSLRKADIDHASAAIILADTAEGPVSDARTVLAALAVETLRPAVYTCVEALSPGTVEHLERAGVDEILPLNALAGSLLARASRNRGVIHAVAELATSGTGSEMYTLPVPQRMVGMTFGDALDQVYRETQAVLFGLHNGQHVVLSPTRDTVLGDGDDLLLIAQDRPVLK